MKRLKFFSSELWLGALVALLSVLVALAAYQSGVSDSKEGDLNVEGQKQLTDSNGYYLEANQYIIYDYTMYDGWYVNEGKDDDAAEYYLANFSEALAEGRGKARASEKLAKRTVNHNQTATAPMKAGGASPRPPRA